MSYAVSVWGHLGQVLVIPVQPWPQLWVQSKQQNQGISL